jgi:hypothetical protein
VRLESDSAVKGIHGDGDGLKKCLHYWHIVNLRIRHQNQPNANDNTINKGKRDDAMRAPAETRRTRRPSTTSETHKSKQANVWIKLSNHFSNRKSSFFYHPSINQDFRNQYSDSPLIISTDRIDQLKINNNDNHDRTTTTITNRFNHSCSSETST